MFLYFFIPFHFLFRSFFSFFLFKIFSLGSALAIRSDHKYPPNRCGQRVIFDCSPTITLKCNCKTISKSPKLINCGYLIGIYTDITHDIYVVNRMVIIIYHGCDHDCIAQPMTSFYKLNIRKVYLLVDIALMHLSYAFSSVITSTFLKRSSFDVNC